MTLFCSSRALSGHRGGATVSVPELAVGGHRFAQGCASTASLAIRAATTKSEGTRPSSAIHKWELN